MKLIFNLPRLAAISVTVAAVSLSGLLAACGQTGPLYLPTKPGPAITPEKTATPLSVPAPADVPDPAPK